MSTPRVCLFIATATSERTVVEVERRVSKVVAFLTPLGKPRATTRRLPGWALAGAIRIDGERVNLDAPCSFAAPLPPDLASTSALLGASDGRLRTLDGPITVLAVNERNALVVTGTGGPATLYRCDSRDIRVWSTHAVAASLLARGRARIAAEAMPEFLAAQFVGGERTLIDGVRAVDAATRVTVGHRSQGERSYWPLEQRWASLPAADAQRVGEHTLLESLERRVHQIGMTPMVGLTAGLDSRVVAAALRELGRPWQGLTWGSARADDVRGGRSVARSLGASHARCALRWFDADAVIRSADREVRWSEGAAPLRTGTPVWPHGMPSLLTGAGGETGRCFYLGWMGVEAPSREPSAAELRSRLTGTLAARLPNASVDALRSLEAAIGGWFDRVQATGHGGWRALDVIYARERLERWGRAMLPNEDWSMLPALATPELARAMVSLPLETRRGDGFHQAFLRRFAPDCRPAVRSRRRRAITRLVAGVRRRARLRHTLFPGPSASRDPHLREWIIEEVLSSPVLSEPLGTEWAHSTRNAILAGEPLHDEQALWAAAPVALSRALVPFR